MAKKQHLPLCSRCDAPLRYETPYCPVCEGPTQWATHDERVSWEVNQWRSFRARQGPASTTTMMLVRTEEGYEPAAVDPGTHYVWDQPLHPDRGSSPAAPNPHVSRESRPVTNGNGNGHAHAPAAPPDPQPAPQAAAFDPGAVATFEPDAEATRDRVPISKKAVAIGIALAIGLPLGGKVLGLTGKPRRAAAPVGSAAGPASQRDLPAVALRATRSGFVQVSPDAVRFAVVVANPNRTRAARAVSVRVTFVDAAGKLLGSSVQPIASVPPGASVAVAGQTGVAGRVARMSARVAATIDGGAASRPFVVRGVRITRSGGEFVVRALVSGTRAVRNVQVVVVHVGKGGAILGGDFAFVDVPRAPGSATAVVSTSSVRPGVDRVEVYVLSPR